MCWSMFSMARSTRGSDMGVDLDIGLDANLTEAALAPGDPALAVLSAPTPLAAFWAAFRENKGAVFGLSIVVVVAATALLAGIVAPHSPIEQFRDAVKAPPVWET